MERILPLYSGKTLQQAISGNSIRARGLTFLATTIPKIHTQDPAPQDKTGVPGNHIWVIQATALGNQQINGICEGRRGDNPDIEKHYTLSVEVV